jgi:hypothetical protein
MPIEIRELIIKVKVDESTKSNVNDIDISDLKNSLLKECKREIKLQLKKSKER